MQKKAILDFSGGTHSILGNAGGNFCGWTWNQSALIWQGNGSIIEGLFDIGGQAKPDLFILNTVIYLVSGEEDGGFFGFRWDNSQWLADEEITSGLTSKKSFSSPAVFVLSGRWQLISGGSSGGGAENDSFNGYSLNETPHFPSNINIDTGNEGYADYSFTGELNTSNSPQTADLNTTAIQSYLDNICTTSLCRVPLNISTDTAGKIQISGINVSYNNITRTGDFSSKLDSIIPACNCSGCNLNNNICSVPFLFHSDTAGKIQYSTLGVKYL